MKHELPHLGYSYDALEPFIDAKTMELHHSKHHQTYVDKFNAALEGHAELQKKPAEEIIQNLNTVPEQIRTAVRNHGGGHINHSFFWPLLKKDIKTEGKVIEAIAKEFGSFEKFKESFNNSANGLFGSGWTWLVLNGNKLEIMNTPNQDSPLSQGKIPLLVIDLWEHSFYLKFNNRRPEYISTFWNVVNWKQVEENYRKAIR